MFWPGSTKWNIPFTCALLIYQFDACCKNMVIFLTPRLLVATFYLEAVSSTFLLETSYTVVGSFSFLKEEGEKYIFC
jgi:hypothetical protein